MKSDSVGRNREPKIIRISAFVGGVKNKHTVDLVAFYDDGAERTLKRYSPDAARRLGWAMDNCAKQAEDHE